MSSINLTPEMLARINAAVAKLWKYSDHPKINLSLWDKYSDPESGLTIRATECTDGYRYIVATSRISSSFPNAEMWIKCHSVPQATPRTA